MPAWRKHRHLYLLGAVLLLGSVLRLWQLRQNGFGTDYYAAGVRSMLESPSNFFFLAFDPAGFVSLDKPPLAFWLQGLSARLFGFHGWSLLLPQVIEGLAAIALLYHLVARRFGDPAGLTAALILALTPVSVAVDRSGNTDSLLVLLLLLAGWTLLRAVETQRLRWLLLAAVFGGLAFNTKMLAAFVLLPAFFLISWCGLQADWRRRSLHLAAAGIVLLGTSLSWAIAFDLTPAEHRPYAGSSSSNSMLELTVLHNGLERFLPKTRHRVMTVDPAADAPQFHDSVAVGPLRLADRHLAAQVLWLLPLALAGVIAAWRRRDPSQHSDVMLWGLWALSYGIVFSAAGGIFHAYYLAVLAPPLAALAGIGIVLLWPQRRRLAVVLLLTAAWQAYIGSGSLNDAAASDPALWLMLLPAAATLPALLLPHRPAIMAAAIVALLNPLVWSWSNAAARGFTMLPSADLDHVTGRNTPETARRWRRMAAATLPPTQDAKLFAFLRANRHGERFALVTVNTRLAAPVILHGGLPAMAFGGFSGTDPILGLEALAQRAQRGELRFVLLSRGMPTGAGPLQLAEDDPRRQFFRWVVAHGRPVSPDLWRDSAGGAERAMLYDLRPEAGPPVAGS
jgi:4-amino-4-deoxy-L-arabinose transferase-like glycosyltransferase